ncbi:SpoIIE family protein phosphatase [Georgenia sp. M64]|uniref:SpoIIE family protein phosphatase n=1 Tax=Georgenia sp. M64 TaxID=3120520 RepID=UPI0030E32AC7
MNAPPDPWDGAPCGLVRLRPDGTVSAANETFLTWLGRPGAEVLGGARFTELLSVGGRIFWETHLSPLLLVDGRFDEVALELRTPHGRLPVLVAATVRPGGAGQDEVVVAVSGARERTRYERDLLAARRAAETSAARTAALLAATSALSLGVGVDGVGAAVLEAATGRLGAAAASLWLTDPDGLVLHSHLGPASPRPRPAREGRSTRGEWFVAPLHGQTRLHGFVSLLPDPAPGAEPLDPEIVTAVAAQAGLALDRALLYERSTSIAHQLQGSLLAGEPPSDPRFDVTTAYHPGVDTLAVGGDWFDAFRVDEDTLAVVVGDVVGRGLGAAIAMGQLRSAVRAVAGPGTSPAEVLTRLDRFVEQVDGAASATLAYVELDLGTGRARYACAGHMPPLLLPVDGPGRLVWGGRSTPLGLEHPRRRRVEDTLDLAAGDRLLLFTDGLVERRDRSLRTGLASLTTHVDEVAALPPAELVTALTARLLEGAQGHDDVCVLMLRRLGVG